MEEMMLPISEMLKARTMQLKSYKKATMIAYLKLKAEKSPNPTVIIIVQAQ